MTDLIELSSIEYSDRVQIIQRHVLKSDPIVPFRQAQELSPFVDHGYVAFVAIHVIFLGQFYELLALIREGRVAVRPSQIGFYVIAQYIKKCVIHYIRRIIDFRRGNHLDVFRYALQSLLVLSFQGLELIGSQFRIAIINPFLNHDVGRIAGELHDQTVCPGANHLNQLFHVGHVGISPNADGRLLLEW